MSIRDFTREDIEAVFKASDLMLELYDREKYSRLLEGKILALLFFEPSTRTRISFEVAMKRLGGAVIGFAEPYMSSVQKGETLIDTVRVLDGYADVLVIRHPNEGAARLAAEYAQHPVINAGSGRQEHPTQALLDLYTIYKEKGAIDGLCVGVMGDLRYARTVNSLLLALANFKVDVHLVSPVPFLDPRPALLEEIRNKVAVQLHRRLQEVLPQLDVLYITRVQKERFPDPSEYERVRGTYFVNRDTLKEAKDDLLILHPLPRVDELSIDVDTLPGAAYFRQAHYGVIVRMALLALVLGALQ